MVHGREGKAPNDAPGFDPHFFFKFGEAALTKLSRRQIGLIAGPTASGDQLAAFFQSLKKDLAADSGCIAGPDRDLTVPDACLDIFHLF
jgi:hypothetical protein